MPDEAIIRQTESINLIGDEMSFKIRLDILKDAVIMDNGINCIRTFPCRLLDKITKGESQPIDLYEYNAWQFYLTITHPTGDRRLM